MDTFFFLSDWLDLSAHANELHNVSHFSYPVEKSFNISGFSPLKPGRQKEMLPSIPQTRDNLWSCLCVLLAYQTSHTSVIETRKSICEDTKHYHVDLDVLSAFVCVRVWPL